MYTLDTNALIYYVSGEEVVRTYIERALGAGHSLYVSAITVAELLRFPDLTAREEQALRAILSLCTVISIDAVVAERAGVLGRVCNVKLADSLIAATALLTSTTLVTRNVRDFRNIPHLTLEAL